MTIVLYRLQDTYSEDSRLQPPLGTIFIQPNHPDTGSDEIMLCLFSALRLAVTPTFAIVAVRRLTELPFLERYRKAKLRTFAIVLFFRVLWNNPDYALASSQEHRPRLSNI